MIAAKRPPWTEAPGRTMLAARAIFLVMVVVGLLYPLLNVIASSISSPRAFNSDGSLVSLPFPPNFTAYRLLFSRPLVAHAILVSAGVTAVGTLATMIVTTALAYALSRRMLGGRALFFLVLLSFLLPANFIPIYLVVRSLHLLNSYASLILPVLVNSLGVIVIRQFFLIAVPADLGEAARLDGASEMQILLKITLPLSKAVIAVIALFTAANYWNDYLSAVLYLDDSRMWPLPLIFRLAGGGPPTISSAAVVISALPIFCLYPFLHSFFAHSPLWGGAPQERVSKRGPVSPGAAQVNGARSMEKRQGEPMNPGHLSAESEAQLTYLVQQLKGYREDERAEQFRRIGQQIILPSLEAIARRLQEQGHNCKVEASLEQPFPAAGPAVYLTFDGRYAAGERSLSIRLAPGESLVRIDRPIAGILRTERLPLSNLTPDLVQRLALEYLRAAIQ